MSTETKFATVLTTSDSRFVDMVVAAFEAEGIPCQHPGKNHAALLPGFTYIEIELRVPEDRAPDARALVEQLRARPMPEDGSRVAFRVSRNYRRLGALLGAIAGIVWINVDFRSAPEAITAALLGATLCGGYLAGRAVSRDMCSQPGCAGQLEREAEQCAKCGARIIGTVGSTRDHFEALEKISRIHS